MPDDTPDYPSRDAVGAYLESYVERFELWERIRLSHPVERAERLDGGGWSVDGERFDVLIAANGHNEEAAWPTPPYPGSFDGEQLHAIDYRDAEGLRDRDVL